MKLLQRFFRGKAAVAISADAKPAADDVVGMITERERTWFRRYAADIYSGAGAIVDLGCFVGSSTIALAEGLLANPNAVGAKIHAYDRFLWDDFLKDWWNGKNLPPPHIVNESVLPEFLDRTLAWHDQIIVHEQDLNVARWESGPIEFLLVDAMKSPELGEAISREFFSRLVPGKSYLAHQDFAHFFTSWIHLLQFRLRNHFDVVADVPKSGTVVFQCKKTLSPEDLRGISFHSSPAEEIEEAFAYSLGIVSQDKRANIIAAKAMAYVHRGDLDRARQVLKTVSPGTKTLGRELEKVVAIIEQAN